jgi:hypothetical protein
MVNIELTIAGRFGAVRKGFADIANQYFAAFGSGLALIVEPPALNRRFFILPDKRRMREREKQPHCS